MAKTITFTYQGKEYTLEYNRKTVSQMERRGFDVEAIAAKPVTMFPLLFWGAFQKNHKGTPQETTDEIWKCLSNRESLMNKLITMYGETIDSLFEEPDENEGNVSWDPSW